MLASPVAAPSDTRHGALSEAYGVVSDGVTVFDGEVPAVANLDPELLGALRRAATDAADDGVEFFVNSGWRSPEYQAQLLHEAVAKYGSEKEAARWVAGQNASPCTTWSPLTRGGGRRRLAVEAEGAAKEMA